MYHGARFLLHGVVVEGTFETGNIRAVTGLGLDSHCRLFGGYTERSLVDCT